MGKPLILTEKPSVGRDFAKALGLKKKGNGHIDGDSAAVTWVIGHLLEALPPDGYDPKFKAWDMSMLPIIPEKFRFKPAEGKAEQIANIKKMVQRRDIDSVVIATDAGREGELIARLILDQVGCQKPIYRFWTSQALTPEVIQFGMTKGLKPASEFDRIHAAGLQRMMADWLVGINLTRAASMRMGGNELYSVGRVQTAVLALLVDRKKHRDNFKPEPYWVFLVTFKNENGTWVGSWFQDGADGRETRFRSKGKAREVALKINGKDGLVQSIEKQKKRKPPPPLFSLTNLQREANKLYGFSAKKTLDLAQRLYEEHQCISYPRTDSTVLGSKGVSMAQSLVSKMSQAYPEIYNGVERSLISEANKRVFNDAKLTDHHALIPLAPAPRSVTDDDRKIYQMIMYRFAAVFYPDYEYESTELVTVVAGETFLTRGHITLKEGWRQIYGGGASAGEQTIPPVAKGDPAHIGGMDGEQKQTRPLPDYTEATLLEDMSNPAKYVEEDELKLIYRGDIGLGTQATRAQIIETLLQRRYTLRDGKKILATDKGVTLIDFIRQLKVTGTLASPAATAKWEQRLTAISLGEAQAAEFEKQMKQWVPVAITELRGADSAPLPASMTLGKCPACGGDIIRGRKGYGCANYRSTGCKFVIWQEVSGKKLSEKTVRMLLDNKISPEYQFKSRKTGNAFKARLRLEKVGDVYQVKMLFGGSNGQESSGGGGSNSDQSQVQGVEATAVVIGKCPDCGSDVIDRGRFYGCQGYQSKGCKFALWKVVAKKSLAAGVFQELLSDGKTSERISGFTSKKGGAFSAQLVLEFDETRGQSTAQFRFV